MAENKILNMNSKPIMEAIQKQIDDAVNKGANLLMPSQILSEIPAMHNITIEYVNLSPEVDDGDIYPKQGDDTKFIITKQGIMKLCACAGVEWNWQYCGRTDNGRDRDYISYRVVGAVRKLDGSWMSLQGEYDLDFEVLEDDLREQYTNRSKKWNKSQKEKDAYVESATRKELIRLRRYKMGRCETGAMLRALRGLLTLKNSYTKAELEKPFVIARLAFQPDYNDPEIRKQLVAASTQAIHGVFGGQPETPANSYEPDPSSPVYDCPTEFDDNLSPEPEEPDPNDGMGSDEKPGTNDGMDSEEIDFINSDDAEQVRILRSLSSQAGIPVSEERFMPERKNKWLDLFKYLKEQIASKKAPEDGIPF